MGKQLNAYSLLYVYTKSKSLLVDISTRMSTTIVNERISKDFRRGSKLGWL